VVEVVKIGGEGTGNTEYRFILDDDCSDALG
jgi:hypothetical protein